MGFVSVCTCDTTFFSPQLALSNALRYFEPKLHAELAKEFAEELRAYGHIYMYRFLPDVKLRLVQYIFDVNFVPEIYLCED